MPTNQIPDDAELSRLLGQAEPPQSPEHLDETILRYARENVPGAEESAVKTPWFPRPLTTAVATLSIAAVAVSISITSFNNGDLERSNSELSSAPIVSSDAFTPEAFVVEEAISGDAALENETTRERQEAENLANNPSPVGATGQFSRASDDNIAPASAAELRADELGEDDLGEIAAQEQALIEENNRVAQAARNELELAAAAAAADIESELESEIMPDQFSAGAVASSPAENLTSTNLQQQEQSAIALSSTAQTTVALEQNTAATSQDAILGGRVEADSALATDSDIQSGIASSSPQIVLRRSAPSEVRASPILADTNSNQLSTENLPALLTLIENLLNSIITERELQAEISLTEELPTEAARASQLQSRFSAISDESELQQLNATYNELRVSFTDFALPATLDEAVLQLQQLNN